ncbi:MAG: hypothetical protein AAGF77_04695 [Bacteroidota bacterium]
MERLRAFIDTGVRFQGLTVFSEGGTDKYALLLLQKKKGELSIEQSQIFTDWEATVPHLKASLPLCVVFSQNGVITKSIATSRAKEPAALVNSAFPNLDFENIFYEIQAFGEATFVAIARRALVLDHLEKMKLLKIKPVTLTLGLGAMEIVTPFLSNTVVATPSGTLEIPEGEDEDTPIRLLPPKAGPVTEVYNISGLSVGASYVNSFASVLSFIAKAPQHPSNLSDLSAGLQSEYVTQRRLSLLAKTAVALFLGLLLINFFFFNHYFQKVTALREQVIVSDSNKKTYRELKEQVAAKEDRVNTIRSNSNSKVSYYLDQMAFLVPEDIKLELLTYQPLAMPVRNDKEMAFEGNTLEVFGISRESTSYLDWVQQLEKYPWIQAVETISFDYQSKDRIQFGTKIVFREQ